MDELEGAVPVFNNGVAVFGTGFIIKDLEVNAVAFGLEARHDRGRDGGDRCKSEMQRQRWCWCQRGRRA